MTRSSRTRTRVRRLAAAAALLAVAGVGCTSTTEAPSTAPAAAVDEPAGDEVAGPVDEPIAEALAEEVETVAVFLVRDPFRPVVTTASGGGAEGGDPADPSPADPADPADPTDPVDPTDPADPADPADPSPSTDEDGCVAAGSGQVCDGELVELLDVRGGSGAEQADVRVDDNVYTVAEGDRFAEHYLVQSIDPPCASFLHGDELFTLCEGQQVLK